MRPPGPPAVAVALPGEDLELHPEASAPVLSGQRETGRVPWRGHQDAQDQAPAEHDLLDVQDHHAVRGQGVEEGRRDPGPVPARQREQQGRRVSHRCPASGRRGTSRQLSARRARRSARAPGHPARRADSAAVSGTTVVAREPSGRSRRSAAHWRQSRRHRRAERHGASKDAGARRVDQGVGDVGAPRGDIELGEGRRPRQRRPAELTVRLATPGRRRRVRRVACPRRERPETHGTNPSPTPNSSTASPASSAATLNRRARPDPIGSPGTGSATVAR